MSHSLSYMFHIHHTFCSHFQTPPHLSNASPLWLFLQQEDPPPEALGSHVCHQIYQLFIPSEGRNCCPGWHHLTPRDACQRFRKLGFPEESSNEMCQNGHTYTAPGIFFRVYFYFKSMQWGRCCWGGRKSFNLGVGWFGFSSSWISCELLWVSFNLSEF